MISHGGLSIVLFSLLCLSWVVLAGSNPLHHSHAHPIPIPTLNVSDRDAADVDAGGLVLTGLVVINRHGHRAPNAPYWSYCPNDRKNRKRYDVDPEDLSGLGMEEEFTVGSYIRRRYRRFIGPRFNRTLHIFRAVGEPRVLQSATAVAQGIFPEGFGPGGYIPSRPQFVPIFSDMDTHEYLLDDVPCFRRAESDVKHWIEHCLNDFVADPNVKEVTKFIRKVCGKPIIKPPRFYDYVKTVTDGMTFNSDLGLKVCGGRVSPEMFFRIRNVSFNLLLARLYHTDDQQTYTAVDLPYRFLRIMHHNHIAQNSRDLNDYTNTRQTSTFYFVHREALYAFGQFFGFTFNIPGLPSGELPVASTLMMERLEPRNQTEEKEDESSQVVYVRFVLWTPDKGTHTVAVPSCRVPHLCSLKELQKIYDVRVARTGTWDKICNYNISELDHNTDIR